MVVSLSLQTVEAVCRAFCGRAQVEVNTRALPPRSSRNCENRTADHARTRRPLDTDVRAAAQLPSALAVVFVPVPEGARLLLRRQYFLGLAALMRQSSSASRCCRSNVAPGAALRAAGA